MPRLFSIIRQDTCIFCNKDRAIELYDINDNPIRFSFILDNERYVLLDRREIHYGECKYCKRKFMLDWSSNDRIPRPLLENKSVKFIQQYNKSKVVV